MTQIISLWNLYDRDYLQWVDDTVNKLRIGDFASLDMDNLIEEIEDLGRSQQVQIALVWTSKMYIQRSD